MCNNESRVLCVQGGLLGSRCKLAFPYFFLAHHSTQSTCMSYLSQVLGIWILEYPSTVQAYSDRHPANL